MASRDDKPEIDELTASILIAWRNEFSYWQVISTHHWRTLHDMSRRVPEGAPEELTFYRYEFDSEKEANNYRALISLQVALEAAGVKHVKS